MALPIKIDLKKPLIRDLKNTVPLEQVLPVIFAKMGLKPENWPSPNSQFNEWQLLIDHIKTNYRTIRVEEIKIAFEYALKGKFEVDTQHYQNFSCEYFSRIVNAYLKYKAPFSRQTKQLPEPPKNDQVIKNLELLIKIYGEWTADYPFKSYHEWIFYADLEHIGVEVMGLDQKKKLFAQISEELPKKFQESNEKFKSRVRIECQKQAFRIWIEDKKSKNIDISKEINEKNK
jgi:hypothetical protein